MSILKYFSEKLILKNKLIKLECQYIYNGIKFNNKNKLDFLKRHNN